MVSIQCNYFRGGGNFFIEKVFQKNKNNFSFYKNYYNKID